MQKLRRLPRVATEMLAIVAQHQPVSRAEVEQIRAAFISQASIDRLLAEGLSEPVAAASLGRTQERIFES